MSAPSSLLIFDDGQGRFGPITDLRACFEMRTGMFTTAGRMTSLWPRTTAMYQVGGGLGPLIAERHRPPFDPAEAGEDVLCLNGRWPMPSTDLMPPRSSALIEAETGAVVAARLSRSDAADFLAAYELPDHVRTSTTDGPVLLQAAWDVIRFMKQTIVHDINATRVLSAIVPDRLATVMGDAPVKIASTAHVAPNVVLDATNGPIYIDDHATVRPGAILCGPCAIAGHSTVLDQALIKANTVIGPQCKVAGEVGGTIFQGFANKAHDGHLGDSWVGKWVNLGAATTNSNLLNTYASVPMKLEADGPREKTGMTFLGTIFGDHVKTAIGTRIMTGTVFGTGAMIASSTPPPTTVRRFAWLTDDGERMYRLNKFVDVMRTVMARRDRTPSQAYLDVIESLHAASTPPA